MKKIKLGILIVMAAVALVSVASALPSTLIIDSDDITGPNIPVSYFQIITQNGDLELPAGAMPAMCMGYYITGSRPDLGNEWKTWDTRVAHSYPAYVGTIEWNRVNWIANNLYDDGDPLTTNDWEITQAALWKLDGASLIPHPTGHHVGSYNFAAFDDYWNNGVMSAEAGAFVPGDGQYYVALLTKDGLNALGTPVQAQPMAVRIPVRDIPSPEFPTIALPVAMLIGVVGVVEFIRTKKE